MRQSVVGGADAGLWLENLAGIPLEPARPLLWNEDGTFSTEKTFTFEDGGKHHVIPSIVWGQRFDPDTAFGLFKAGVNPAVGSFDSAEEAEKYAVGRSKLLGVLRDPDKSRFQMNWGNETGGDELWGGAPKSDWTSYRTLPGIGRDLRL